MEEKILELLAEIDEGILSYDGDDLFEAGLLDSFQVIELVEMLEENFDMEIDAEHVVAENFATKEAILELMRRLLA
ncbi:MAG: acyl carrier protein [Lachnospiraceae bacterium]|jgi:acyl carrier protein|nr:phosphopantetheine-binding protein [uncultured Acetatifactor sp.]MCI9229530.1 acyl carrier protein [Lachnospiraceae bacterium]MCI9571025.1 acyl carrier protein [Lachnospiraceae bacterium]